MKLRLLAPFLAGGLVIGVDQLLKSWFIDNSNLYIQTPILGQKWLVMAFTLNQGMMGNYLWNLPHGIIERYTCYLPSAALIAVSFFVCARFLRASNLERIASMLLLAGGASNLWDNWHSDSVLDTLEIYIGAGPFSQYLPFNVADAAITLGASILVITFFRELLGSATALAESQKSI